MQSKKNVSDYWTLRGNEETSNLLAVRSAVADGVELLMWERKHEGNYKSKDKRQKQMKAYARTLMAKIMLKQNVGYMGKESRVVVVRLHFQVANKKQGPPQKQRRVLAMACRQTQATQHPSSHGGL